MTDDKAGATALAWIDANTGRLTAVSDRLWEFAEVGLEEFESARLLERELTAADFTLVSGVAGMPTAFTATWGQGKPVLGFLAEYDALPLLSQEASPVRKPLREGAPGHGCGHNLYGAAVLGAVLALKEEMVRESLPGTIVFFGCPAEETLIGKVLMARAGLFSGLDAALTWHPAELNSLWAASAQAMNSAKLVFHGRAAHAAASPDQGRSALDAVELMNIGANYLREHVPQDTRLHYVITKGGVAPNIVPAEAEVWYYVRSPRRADVDSIYARLLKIAEGAALMTETTFDVNLITSCREYLPNDVLGDLLMDCLTRIGPPAWTADELAFAQAITDTFAPGQKEGSLRAGHVPASYWGKLLDDTICPPLARGECLPGSTDVADTSWATPTACSVACCAPLGTAGHSWQYTATSGMSIGHKGLLLSAKALAMAGSELLRHPEVLVKAREEFNQKTLLPS